MKVKDFIDYLSHLDSEKDIWIVYDGGYGYVCLPNIVEVYHGQFTSSHVTETIKDGDYIFDVS